MYFLEKLLCGNSQYRMGRLQKGGRTLHTHSPIRFTSHWTLKTKKRANSKKLELKGFSLWQTPIQDWAGNAKEAPTPAARPNVIYIANLCCNRISNNIRERQRSGISEHSSILSGTSQCNFLEAFLVVAITHSGWADCKENQRLLSHTRVVSSLDLKTKKCHFDTKWKHPDRALLNLTFGKFNFTFSKTIVCLN